MKKLVVSVLALIFILSFSSIASADPPLLLGPLGETVSNQPILSWQDYDANPVYVEISTSRELSSGGWFTDPNKIKKTIYTLSFWDLKADGIVLAPGTYYWQAQGYYYYATPVHASWSLVSYFIVPNTDAGTTTPTPTVTIQSTSVGLKASPKAIKAGKAVTVKGQLNDSNAVPLAGKKIKIKANGKVIKTVTTNAGGSFSFKHKPKKTTKYQATFVGDSLFKASNSRIVKVIVKKINKKARKK